VHRHVLTPLAFANLTGALLGFLKYEQCTNSQGSRERNQGYAIMRPSSTSFVFFTILCSLVVTTAGTVVNQVNLDGKTYINKVSTPLSYRLSDPVDRLHLKGMVAFGLIPADFRDSVGDSIGGISSIALKPNSWKVGSNGQFTGTMIAHPDRDDM
jgi:hypothetical protein